MTEAKFFNKNQTNNIKRLKRSGICNLFDLQLEYENKTKVNLILDTYQIYNTIPVHIKNLLKQPKASKDFKANIYFPYKLNLWKSYNSIKSSDIRIRIQENKSIDVYSYLANKHNVLCVQSSHSNPFKSIKMLTKEVKLQDLQYKILHNIYPTMRHLFKWKIKETDICPICNEVDNLRHTIYDCTFAKQSLNNLYSVLRTHFNISINLSYEDLIFGLSNNINNNTEFNIALDVIMLLIKREIILQRENKKIISEEQILTLILNRTRIEEKLNDRKTFQKNWSCFVLSHQV